MSEVQCERPPAGRCLSFCVWEVGVSVWPAPRREREAIIRTHYIVSLDGMFRLHTDEEEWLALAQAELEAPWK